MDSNTARIVYASDNRFAEILGVSLVSLYENSPDMENIVVYILDNGIDKNNKEKLDSIRKKYNRTEIIWIQSKDISKELSMDVTLDRGSLSQYARLFISSDISENIDRVLYLDCDIIINKSIRELWNLDLHGKTIGALKDAFSSHYRANIGLEKTDIMFNSGVMLIDLNRWRKEKIEDKLVGFIKEKNGRIQQGDQGALNAILSHDVFCFHPKFNAVTIFFDFTYPEMMTYRKPPKGYYSEEETQCAVSDPNIIHFTTSFLSKRPWIEGCKHKYVSKWLEMKMRSPWRASALWSDTVGGKKSITQTIVRILPRKMMIYIAGIAQAYGRPLAYKLMKRH